MIPTLSRGEIINSLSITPSVSRTGKMAEMAMSTHNLARAGVQAFSSVKKKQPKLGIIVAEVVDAELLDPFGTSQPAVDTGRTNELCSSPREHPQLMAKYTTLKNAERRMAFTKTVNLPTKKGQRGKAAAKYDDMDPQARHQYMFQPDSDDETDNGAKQGKGTSSFKTVPRSKHKPYNIDTPEVGHYRPRFTVIERRAQSALVRGKTGAKPEPLAKRQRPATANARLLGTDEKKTGKEVTIVAPKRPQSAAAAPNTSSGSTTPALPQRGTSPFLSKVKNRPEAKPAPTTSSYWPINESMLSTSQRPGKGAFIEFDVMLDRDKSKIGMRGTQLKSDAPDVVYDNVNTPALTPKVYGEVAFDKMTGGTRGQEAKVMYAADHMDYHPQLPEKRAPTPNFEKTAGRDQVPLNLALIKKAKEMPEEPSGVPPPARRTKQAIPFDKQTNRQPLWQTTSALEYDPSYELVHKRTHTPQLQHGDGHQALFAASITKDCDYNPNYNAIFGQVTGQHTFTPLIEEKKAEPDAHGKGKGADVFYDVDTEVTKPRIKGNPMMKLHLSRDARNHAMRKKTNSPDTFYDYSLEAILPKTTPTSALDFSKTVSRSRSPPNRLV
eukprot:TRINITY_DN94452_c0_g1_i1.p1 TRINITY_DN94452_c0_g1~~TRINITY_DN94452_c0_g1_i1.p1  ORF type:complete len:608 (+),score=34.54 TRINITY_DN94452_c0_g1_i1:36-1859(+)